MRDLLGGFLSLLAPARCAGCDEAAEGPAVFCHFCAMLAEPVSDRGAVFEYGGPVADAIQRFKYDGRSEFGAGLGAVMAEEAYHWAEKVDVVVPVPLHWRRRRARGYDQAALLARPVAKSLGVPVLLRGLRRVRNTPRQVDLPHAERQKNIAGAFVPYRLGGAGRVLLVDDVRTTGATLRAASEALRAGGVSEVHAFVLAARVLVQAT
ncbi:MAG: ComF family protein [Deltaproteobacteria bacterium]|nr:ComF family protein [Deltaproteobacteria bacterium]MBW2210542.1 ComF family protein [Deltaproteobacteria bacterium]MBW2214721.1 ComF family protein [Deltaproteobacteria bacterium]MBW2550163.1 ComF family protein [Deltaproteobacteria bacterium]MBW2626830.1 ComF family protein [Deltaproteobacteria bacterium]